MKGTSMRYLLLVFALLGTSQPAIAQAPLIGCVSTYDCCVQKLGASECAPQHEGIVQQIADDAVNVLKLGSTADNAEQNVSLATAIDGKKLNSYLKHVARHLARILDLREVGGVPPEEPHRAETVNHWWGEVKDAMKNIHQVLKRCKSRRQIMSALRAISGALTESQIADIEARLPQAARKMGDAVGELLPCASE